MKNLILTAIAAVTLAAAIPAFAQDTTTATTEEFPIGKSPDVQIGQPYVLKQEGSWQVRCVKAEVEPESCFIYQLLKDSEGNSVAEVNIFHLPGGGAAVAGANIRTPLGILLQNQVMLSIGGEAPKAYAFGWCEAIGCIAKVGFTGLELESLKKSKDATITISAIVNPSQPIVLSMNLDGFSEGFKAVLVKK